MLDNKNKSTISLSLIVLMIIKNIAILNFLLLTATIGIAQQHNYIDTIKSLHQKTRSITLHDSDHDGVADQFDKELGTPSGCPVDTHGVMLDTDGDGVPDCRDKEKLSRADCFPADSNGIVTCPELNCCTNKGDYLGCYIQGFPSFQFKSVGQILKKQEPLLDSLAREMMNNPVCHIRLQGYYNNQNSKRLALKRIKNIMVYLTDKWDLSKERFDSIIKQGSYINSVNFISY
jgi:OOP family OmpA-OmpF porin